MVPPNTIPYLPFEYKTLQVPLDFQGAEPNTFRLVGALNLHRQHESHR
jgi:hypothetical protein